MKKEKNMDEHRKSKNTLFLAIAFLAASMIGSLFFMTTGKKGAEVLVAVDGKEYYKGSLFVEKELQIREGNTLLIRNGKADMTEADCPDQICVKHEPISLAGETIICLPNRVVVTIVSDENTMEEGVDAIVR